MKLSQFTHLLHSHPDRAFHLVLPGAHTVPLSFHITEVGYITKRFIDCGGKVHNLQACQLQVWIGEDADHRLLAGKMAGVLNIAGMKGVLPVGEDLDVEVEYEDTVISQYVVADYHVSENAVVFALAGKHTDCLAKELCCPPLLPTLLPMASGQAAGCCGSNCAC